MTPKFEDIKICLNYGMGTHFPHSDPNYLGRLVDALIKAGDSEEKVLNNMRFFYGYEANPNKWKNVARTEDDQTIWTTLSMKVNPKVRIIGQDGLFRLAFYGHDVNTGVFVRVETFAEQLKLKGLRLVSIVRPSLNINNEDTIPSSIPKRIEIPRF